MIERLTRDAVIDAAAIIVGSEGLGALSMRALSEKLGVAVTSIYWHVGNKDALLDALVDRVSASITIVPQAGGPPRQRIAFVARSIHGGLQAHGPLIAIAHRRDRLATVFAPARRALAVELFQAGLRGDRLANGVNLVLQYVIADVVTMGIASRAPEQSRGGISLWDDTPPIDRRAARRLEDPPDPEQTFELGLDLLVRGLIASA